MKLYDLQGISKTYSLGRHRVPALRNLDLAIDRAEFVAIAGPSGSGKTTLLNILGLLDGPDLGCMQFDGVETARLSERQRTRLRGERLGLIFQTFHLIPVLTARENVEYFLYKQGCPQAEVRRRALEALEAVGVAAQADQRPPAMSGGQRQRVAIARALARGADVVLADEPTGALDQRTGLGVLDLMKGLNRRRGVTFVFSTHDPCILAAADRVVRLVDGRIAA